MTPEVSLAEVINEIERRLQGAGRTAIGFPTATDIDFSPITRFNSSIINNIGDPEHDGREPRHVKNEEREVVKQVAKLFGGAIPDCWGYVTQAGSTEGNQWGLWLAREKFPQGVLFYSAAAHYSIAKAARILRMSSNAVEVPTDAFGEMDYSALVAAVRSRALGLPVIIVATVGTTFTGAVDDVGRIHEALDDAGVRDRYVHVDGALDGIQIALEMGPLSRLLTVDNAAFRGDSVCISGHKFLGTPHVTGVALARREHVLPVSRPVDYIDGIDATVSGSRSGHSALEIWYALCAIGLTEHRRRAARARQTASYTTAQLIAAGWHAWRHPHSFTVLLRNVPSELCTRWALPSQGDWSHIICVPGVDTSKIDSFLNELGEAPADSVHSPPAARNPRLAQDKRHPPSPHVRPPSVARQLRSREFWQT